MDYWSLEDIVLKKHAFKRIDKRNVEWKQTKYFETSVVDK